MKNGKKLLALILALTMVLALAACAPKPQGTVESFCKAMKQFDLEKLAEYTAEDLDLDEMIANEDGLTQRFMDYFKEKAGNLTYEIKEDSVEGDTAKFTVHVKYTDASEVLVNAMTAYISKIFAAAMENPDREMGDEEASELLTQTFEEEMQKGGEGTAEDDLLITCTKSDAGWKISEISDNFSNILCCNFISAMEEIGSGISSIVGDGE